MSRLPTPPSDGSDKFIEEIKSLDRRQLRALWEAVGRAAHSSITDLWDDPSVAVSHWILTFNSMDVPEERAILQQFTSWKHVHSRDTANIACLGAMERHRYVQACKLLGVVESPSLIVGISPTLDQRIHIGSSVLVPLAKQDGQLVRFLVELHSMIQNGATMDQLAESIHSKAFWSKVKLIYAEIKSFVSVQL